jgi:hypothetical protein
MAIRQLSNCGGERRSVMHTLIERPSSTILNPGLPICSLGLPITSSSLMMLTEHDNARLERAFSRWFQFCKSAS